MTATRQLAAVRDSCLALTGSARFAIALLIGVATTAQALQPQVTVSSEERDRVGRIFLDAVVPRVQEPPSVELYLRAETLSGEAIAGLEAADLRVFDEGRRIDPAQIELQGLDALGESIAWVIAIDASHAMMGRPFDRAREAALEFRRRAGTHDDLAILTFAEDVHVVSGFASDFVATRDALRHLDTHTESLDSKLHDGTAAAIELLRGHDSPTQRRFVVVFSDGQDSGSARELSEVIALADGGMGETRIPVFSVGYARFGTPDFETLERLSHATAGAFFETHSMDHLVSTFGQIRLQMLRSYVARYPGTMNGHRHRVDVDLEGKSDSRMAPYPLVSAEQSSPASIAAVALLISAAATGGYVAKRRRREP